MVQAAIAAGEPAISVDTKKKELVGDFRNPGRLAAARHLRERGGAIVNLGSVLGDRAIALQGSYCAAKHTVKGATDAFRMKFEAAGLPISVTLIKPGPIDTPFMEHARNAMGTRGPGTRRRPTTHGS